MLAPACSHPSSDVREIRHPITHQNFGEIAGRVVDVTSSSGTSETDQGAGTEQPAAGATLMLLDLAAGKQYLETLQQSADKSCSERLGAMQSALTEFAKTSQGGKGAPTTRADGDGYFEFSHLAPGAYLVVAEGRTGTTDALWEQPAEVPQDRAVAVKLASPLVACPASGQ